MSFRRHFLIPFTLQRSNTQVSKCRIFVGIFLLVSIIIANVKLSHLQDPIMEPYKSYYASVIIWYAVLCVAAKADLINIICSL